MWSIYCGPRPSLLESADPPGIAPIVRRIRATRGRPPTGVKQALSGFALYVASGEQCSGRDGFRAHAGPEDVTLLPMRRSFILPRRELSSIFTAGLDDVADCTCFRAASRCAKSDLGRFDPAITGLTLPDRGLEAFDNRTVFSLVASSGGRGGRTARRRPRGKASRRIDTPSAPWRLKATPIFVKTSFPSVRSLIAKTSKSGFLPSAMLPLHVFELCCATGLCRGPVTRSGRRSNRFLVLTSCRPNSGKPRLFDTTQIDLA